MERSTANISSDSYMSTENSNDYLEEENACFIKFRNSNLYQIVIHPKLYNDAVYMAI